MKAERGHLKLDLNETKELLDIYELKNEDLNEGLKSAVEELSEFKREMVGFNQEKGSTEKLTA